MLCCFAWPNEMFILGQHVYVFDILLCDLYGTDENPLS